MNLLENISRINEYPRGGRRKSENCLFLEEKSKSDGRRGGRGRQTSFFYFSLYLQDQSSIPLEALLSVFAHCWSSRFFSDFVRGINGPMSVVILLLLLPLAQGQWAPPRSLGDPDIQRQLSGFVSSFNRKAFGAVNYEGESRPPFAAPLPNNYVEKTTPNPYKPPDPQPRPEFKSQQTNFYPTHVSHCLFILQIQLFRNSSVLQFPCPPGSPALQFQPHQFLRRSKTCEQSIWTPISETGKSLWSSSTSELSSGYLVLPAQCRTLNFQQKSCVAHQFQCWRKLWTLQRTCSGK